MSSVASAQCASSEPADRPSLGGTSAIAIAEPDGATTIQRPPRREVGALLAAKLANVELERPDLVGDRDEHGPNLPI
jgi:hypothetical protein